MSDKKMMKVAAGYALAALVEQLLVYRKEGASEIQFNALATHPQTDDDCTFGDLIEPAFDQLQRAREGEPVVNMVTIAKRSLGIDEFDDTRCVGLPANEEAFPCGD